MRKNDSSRVRGKARKTPSRRFPLPAEAYEPMKMLHAVLSHFSETILLVTKTIPTRRADRHHVLIDVLAARSTVLERDLLRFAALKQKLEWSGRRRASPLQ